ncbi:MAG: SDR family NAD(P)-dependent oxidoreductase [Xanthomonadales bacterium]|nr:SDR family NAD(P)-dependent oxidoreductase [Xanthomonadales bacterium]
MKGSRVAVITGAGSGIGRALAHACERAGHQLVLCDRDSAALEETVGALSATADVSAFDISDREAVHAFATRVLDEHGPPQLLIHNAGVALSQTVANMEYADLEWVMNVNFWGMVYGCKAFLEPMLQAGNGTMVFVSSIFGVVGIPTQSAYNASKFAIRGFAESLREEVGDRMQVLVVCPGGVRTNIIRNGKIRDWPLPVKTGSDPAQAFERLARLEPEQAARAILKAVQGRQKRLILGTDARMLDCLQRLFPSSYHQAARRLTSLLR